MFYSIQGLEPLISSCDPCIPLERKKRERPAFSGIQWSHPHLNAHFRCRQHGVLKSLWFLTVNQVTCLHENSDLRYHCIKCEGWKEALGSDTSPLSHLTYGESEATERLPICPGSHSKLGVASVQDPCFLTVCSSLDLLQHLFALQFTSFSSDMRTSSTSGLILLIHEMG